MIQEQPLSRVIWVHRDQLDPNTYNPNHVPATEMELLEFSLMKLGWVFPIIAVAQGPFNIINLGTHCEATSSTRFDIVDGFHRHKTSGKPNVGGLTDGFVPIVVIDRKDVEMVTVMMNRAKGIHSVQKMADIVTKLLEKGVNLGDIMAGMGMDEEEVIRLAMSNGVARSSIIVNSDFSQSWDAGEIKNDGE